MVYDCNLPHRRFFFEIAQYPHGSANEKPLSDYLVAFAKQRNLEYMQDELYNVIIRKPAAAGYEDAPVLAIQAHMDMVCEKNKLTVHDFEKDPIRFVVSDDGILRADSTTLGADDCTGVAYMLSILDAKDLEHPELECIFTTQEEIGMFGALALKPEDIHAHRMISLDGGGENNTLLTSAGGCRLQINKPLLKQPNEKPCYGIRIRGLTGGHSGSEINKEKGNANKLLVRILKEAMLSGFSFELCDLNGGLKDNAIPRECDAVIAFDGDEAALEQQVQLSAKQIWQELEFSDSGFRVEFRRVDALTQTCTNDCSRQILDMLFLYPNGLMAHSMNIEGLTVTSLNLGILTMDETRLTAVISVRSMLDSAMNNLVNQVHVINELFGASLEQGARYPGWKYSEHSPMRDAMAAVVRELYHEELNVTATHGGCECGVFSQIHSDMDIISIGPVTRHVHTPAEELDLASFDRTYILLTNVVKSCK